MVDRWFSTVNRYPIPSDFTTTSGFGTPIVLNTNTGQLYYLAVGDVVTPCGGIGSIPQALGAQALPGFDNAIYLQAWLDLGGLLWLPVGDYYTSDDLLLRKNAIIEGMGYGFDNRLVNSSATLGYELQPGSRIWFAPGKGLKLQNQTLLTTVAAVTAGGGPVATATQQGACGSRISNIALIGPGTGPASAGLYCVTQVHLDNVWAIKFMGRGFDFSASAGADDGNSEYGNASLSSLRNCHALNNNDSGYKFRGNDCNSILIENCDSFQNGGYATDDDSLLGNNYKKVHAAGNALGSFKATGAVAFHSYDVCYIENDTGRLTSLTAACRVEGGTAANDVNHPAGSPAFIKNIGQAIRAPISGFNNRNATNTQGGLGRSPDGESRTALWWGDSDDINVDTYKIRKNFQWAGLWSINYRNSLDAIEFITGQHSRYGTIAFSWATGFPAGIYMGSIQNSPRLLPAATTVPATGTFLQGDRIFNSTPAVGSPKSWVCTVAGTPGTWVSEGNL